MDINLNKIDFIKSAEEINLHDHLCLIYENYEEQLGAIIPFVKVGLARNEKCAYIADDNTAEDVILALKEIDEDLFGASLTRGNLSVLTKNESYVKDGYFSPEKMISFLENNIHDAANAGFAGLRVTGEMTWIFGGDPGAERMMEYEAKLNDFLPIQNACAICQYNKNRFSDELLLQVFQTHPKVIYKNRIIENPLYLSKGVKEDLMARMATFLATK